MTLPLIFWIAIMLLGFAGSAVYSGLETGSYRLNRVRLHLLDHQGHRPARRLRRLFDHPAALLTTLLIGNNMANYLGTAGLGVILDRAQITDVAAVVINTAIVTPVLLIFGEILPKDLFAAHTDRLMYRFSLLLQTSRRLFTAVGLQPLIVWFGDTVGRLVGGRGRPTALHPRRQVGLLLREGVGAGLLSDEQTAIVDRVLGMATRTAADEMTPWRRVLALQVRSERSLDAPAPPRLRELASQTSRSHLPVLTGSGKVIAVVTVLDALRQESATGPDTPMRAYARKPLLLPKQTPLREALDRLRAAREPIAIVVDARQRPVGVVSVKDLVEPITGELASW